MGDCHAWIFEDVGVRLSCLTRLDGRNFNPKTFKDITVPNKLCITQIMARNQKFDFGSEFSLFGN
jgi:hypothetical protein